MRAVLLGSLRNPIIGFEYIMRAASCRINNIKSFQLSVDNNRVLGAGYYEWVSLATGLCQWLQEKKIDTPAGTQSVSVYKTAKHHEGCGEPFFP